MLLLFLIYLLLKFNQNFGFLKPRTQTTLQNYFTSQIGCTSTDRACLNGLNLTTIINAQMSTFGAAPTLDPAAGSNVPIRPVLDGSLITSPLDLSGAFPAQNKPLLITSVAQEAGFAIYSYFTQPLPQAVLRDISVATFGTNRTDIILANPLYAPTVAPDGTSDIRPLLQKIGTDSLWRCSSWSFARSWVQSGGTAYVGEYIVGASYPGNEVAPYCTQPGIVCHQDDIEIVVSSFHQRIHCRSDGRFSSLAPPPVKQILNRHSLLKCKVGTNPSYKTVTPMRAICPPGPRPAMSTFTLFSSEARVRLLLALAIQAFGVKK